MVHVLLLHLEGLANTGRTHLKFIVAQLVAHALLQEAAQFGTVFNPHTIGVVYLDGDAVAIHSNVYQEIVALLEPLFHQCFDCVLCNHQMIWFITEMRGSCQAPHSTERCKGTNNRPYFKIISRFLCRHPPFLPIGKAKNAIVRCSDNFCSLMDGVFSGIPRCRG